MAKLTYSEQLKHPNWQRKRLEKLQQANFACEMCADKESTLHVHHRRYVKGREVWEYELAELQVLCESCHAEHHEMHALLDELLFKAEAWDAYRTAVGLLGGWLTPGNAIDADLSARAEAAGGPTFAIGVAAYALALSSRYDVAKALLELTRDDINGPVVDRLIARWSQHARPEDTIE